MSRRCSWLMASRGCHTRTDFQYGQGKETIWWAPYLQQRKEIQTRPSTLLFHYAEQRSAHGSLLRLDEQLCRSFQLQVLPAVPCVHSHLIKLGMLCDVECSLRPSLRARHNSDHRWMRWIGWTASFSADSFPVLPHLDAVQKHDDHRILWKDGGGTLRLAIWHGGLGQPAKRLGRKCSFVVSTSALYAWEWNRMAKGELLDKVIRFKEGFRRWVSWSSAAWRSENPYVCMKVGKADAERYPHDWADSCMQHVPHAEQALDWLNARPWLPLMFQGQSAKPGNLDKAWPVTFHDILAETWGLKFEMQRIQNMQTAEVRNLLTWEFGSFWRSLAWCWRWGAVTQSQTKTQNRKHSHGWSKRVQACIIRKAEIRLPPRVPMPLPTLNRTCWSHWGFKALQFSTNLAGLKTWWKLVEYHAGSCTTQIMEIALFALLRAHPQKL